MESILMFAEKYPTLVGLVLTVVVWPMLSAAINYLFRPVSEEEAQRIEREHPRWSGFLRMTRGSGLDTAKTLAGAKQMITGKLKLPPPPEVKP